MSYSHYQHNPTGTSYPYAAYHPGTPGAYQPQGYAAAYQSAYASGVTGYGAWPYPYSYIPQQQTQNTSQVARSAVQTPLTPATATATPSAVATPKPTTFSSYTPTYVRETGATLGTTTAVTGRGRKHANFKGLFMKELKNLMYGFGDDRNPATDTVNVMEEILVEFIVDVCQTAGGPQRKTRLSIEDLRRALSRPADAKKLARMEELLFMQEDIKRARAQFEESDMSHPKDF
ncbi:transcription initiation factor IID, 18kD subunit-domain-containing protein [Butyriboletus roseoflavus]|nr:transcription initiation factor IID, 18kD subunit-domain-containing protein [Butyriboletus roseoflavus]